MPILQITASGTPYEIGFAHGTQARARVHGTRAFYTGLFAHNAHKTWAQVLDIATSWLGHLGKWPALVEEMQGLADGAQVGLADIVALNVRTEIAFGLFSDGCTALSWKDAETSWVGQNWDWETPQRENLVLLDVRQEGKPRLVMVTEAGIVGKIGLNECGVGVCLNAIRKTGMDVGRIPCHLGLRMVLESRSREEAVATLEEFGVASACHMLIADGTGGVGVEWSSTTSWHLKMNERGQVFHSNHYLHPEITADQPAWLPDSKFRVSRIEELCRTMDDPDMAKLQAVFRDEVNYPGAICRKQEGSSTAETLFNIVMDLTNKRARVTVGRPVAAEEQIEIQL